MADAPWKGKTLSPGQITQLFESKGCTFFKVHPGGGREWIAPSGHHFTLSDSDCDDQTIERVIAQIDKWLDGKGSGKS